MKSDSILPPEIRHLSPYLIKYHDYWSHNSMLDYLESLTLTSEIDELKYLANEYSLHWDIIDRVFKEYNMTVFQQSAELYTLGMLIAHARDMKIT